jgi:hypothetical protein
MIVMASEGIGHLADHVRRAMLPSALDPYAASDLRFTAMCLDLIAEDYDRAVDVLSADREEIADIFAKALPHLESDLRDRVGARLARKPTNLRVRTLTQEGDDDMRVLIELHREAEKVEQLGEAWAIGLNAEIWRFLENYAARRIYRSPI